MTLALPGRPHGRSLFHSPTRYAIQALIRMPADGSYRLARHLAVELDLPGPFLAKILQTLAQAGILESQRGPSGGFRLNRRPEALSLREVFLAMEGPEPFERCLLGHPDCVDTCQCPVRPAWDMLQDLLTHVFAETTLLDLQRSHRPSLPPVEGDESMAAPI